MNRLTMVLASMALMTACNDSNDGTGPGGPSNPGAAPTVTSTGPASAATGVPRNPAIRATFSEPMNAVTLNTGTFTLSHAGIPVAGAVTYTGNTATLIPA